MAKERLYVKSVPPQIEGVDPFYVDRELSKIENGFLQIDEYVEALNGTVDAVARDDISDLQTRVGTIEENEGNTLALIEEERTQRQTADISEATARLALKAELDQNTADLEVLNTVVVDANQSFAQQLTTLESDYQGNKASVSQSITTLSTGQTSLARQFNFLSARVGENSALIAEENVARVTADQALAQQTTLLETNFNNNVAQVQNQLTALSTADSAQASAILSTSTRVGTLETTVTTTQESINGIKGKWGVTINNNGAITGIELNSGDNQKSEFKIQADRFKIEPQTAGSAVSPFYVEGGTTYIENAVIKNGSITQVVSTNFPGSAGQVTPVNLTLSSVPAGVPIFFIVSGAIVTGPGVNITSQGLRALDGNGDYVGFSPTQSIVVISSGGNQTYQCYRNTGFDASVVIMVLKK